MKISVLKMVERCVSSLSYPDENPFHFIKSCLLKVWDSASLNFGEHELYKRCRFLIGYQMSRYRTLAESHLSAILFFYCSNCYLAAARKFCVTPFKFAKLRFLVRRNYSSYSNTENDTEALHWKSFQNNFIKIHRLQDWS